MEKRVAELPNSLPWLLLSFEVARRFELSEISRWSRTRELETSEKSRKLKVTRGPDWSDRGLIEPRSIHGHNFFG
jgi:hypothetical protein